MNNQIKPTMQIWTKQNGMWHLSDAKYHSPWDAINFCQRLYDMTKWQIEVHDGNGCTMWTSKNGMTEYGKAY